MRRVVSLGVGSLVSLLLVIACVGDDPDNSSPPPLDARDGAAGDSAQAQDVTTTLPPSDSSSASDVTTPQTPQDAGYDAGAPIWVSPAALSFTVMSSAVIGTCRFELAQRNLHPAGQPEYQIAIIKRDGAAMCNEPKGMRVLASTWATPTALLLNDQVRGTLAVAYNEKSTQSGSSPNGAYLRQIEPFSGNDLRLAFMKTKDVQGQPVTASLPVEQLFFGDQTEAAEGTLRFYGSGSFPGCRDTGQGEGKFKAVFRGFLGARPQPAAAADTCELAASL